MKAIEELRVNRFDLRNHFADDGAAFAGSVASGAHAPEPVQDDAGQSVHHGGEGGDGKDVASDFDRALFGRAFDFLQALRMGHGAYVPDVVENVARVADQNSSEFAVVIPGAGDGAFIDFLGFFVEEEGDGRNVGLRTVEAYIALALLLGIVKRMGVKKRPDELAADVFEPNSK